MQKGSESICILCSLSFFFLPVCFLVEETDRSVWHDSMKAESLKCERARSEAQTNGSGWNPGTVSAGWHIKSYPKSSTRILPSANRMAHRQDAPSWFDDEHERTWTVRVNGPECEAQRMCYETWACEQSCHASCRVASQHPRTRKLRIFTW